MRTFTTGKGSKNTILAIATGLAFGVIFILGIAIQEAHAETLFNSEGQETEQVYNCTTEPQECNRLEEEVVDLSELTPEQFQSVEKELILQEQELTQNDNEIAAVYTNAPQRPIPPRVIRSSAQANVRSVPQSRPLCDHLQRRPPNGGKCRIHNHQKSG